MIKRLYWDIETSPNIMYSWRSGRQITLGPENILEERNVICICWKWQGSDELHSLTWEPWNDEKMIRDFSEVLARADEAVAHNGDRFDLRWYQGRHLIHKLPPMPSVHTIDTLKIARRCFYMNSNRLDYLGKMLFGKGKHETGYGLWKKVCGQDVMDVLAIKAGRGDDESLNKMVEYCKNDVCLVEAVHDRIEPYDKPATHAGVAHTKDVKMRWTCPTCASTHVQKYKNKFSATGMRKHEMRCMECNRYYTIANNVFGWREDWVREQKLKQ